MRSLDPPSVAGEYIRSRDHSRKLIASHVADQSVNLPKIASVKA